MLMGVSVRGQRAQSFRDLDTVKENLEGFQTVTQKRMKGKRGRGEAAFAIAHVTACTSLFFM